MRFLGGLLAAGLSTVAVAAASSLPTRDVSSVYYKHSSKNPSHTPTTLTVSQFTLALAHRLGLSQFYSIFEQDDVFAITKVDSAVPGAGLFGGNGKGKLVVHISGVDRELFSDIKPTYNVASRSAKIDQSFFSQAEQVMGAELWSEWIVSPWAEKDHKDRIEILSHSYRYTSEDSSSWDDEFLKELVQPDIVSKLDHQNTHHQIFITGLTSLQHILLNGLKEAIDNGEYAFIHVPLLKWLEPNSEAYAAGVQLLSAYFHFLLTTHDHHQAISDLTLLVSPTFQTPYLLNKPLLNSELKKRKEIPISLSTPSSPLPPPQAHNKESTNPLEKSTVPTASRLHIPRIFKSKETCEAETNNCTSHGKCIRSDYPSKESWSCKCQSTEKKVGSGIIKKYWAGNACQKEDISAQFHLILIFTILMIGAIAAGIGAMAKMGAEELPGVLTAGMPVKKQ